MSLDAYEKQKKWVADLVVKSEEHEKRHLPRKVYLLERQMKSAERRYLEYKQEYDIERLEYETCFSQLPVGVTPDTQGRHQSDDRTTKSELICGCVRCDCYDDAGMGPYFSQTVIHKCDTCLLKDAKEKLVDMEKAIAIERKKEEQRLKDERQKMEQLILEKQAHLRVLEQEIQTLSGSLAKS